MELQSSVESGSVLINCIVDCFEGTALVMPLMIFFDLIFEGGKNFNLIFKFPVKSVSLLSSID